MGQWNKWIKTKKFTSVEIRYSDWSSNYSSVGSIAKGLNLKVGYLNQYFEGTRNIPYSFACAIYPAICKLLNHIEIPGPKNSVGNSWPFWVIAQWRYSFSSMLRQTFAVSVKLLSKSAPGPDYCILDRLFSS